MTRALVFALTPLLTAPTALWAQTSDLSDVLTDCWNSVASHGLESLERYEMRFERTDTPRPSVHNDIWVGLARTEIGDISVKAVIREEVLFDCTLMTFPEPPDWDTIEFSEAAGVLDAWYSAKIREPDHFSLLDDVPFFGVVRCSANAVAISSAATSMGAFDPSTIRPGDEHLVPGTLRVATFRTSPRNFDFCEGTDL